MYTGVTLNIFISNKHLPWHSSPSSLTIYTFKGKNTQNTIHIHTCTCTVPPICQWGLPHMFFQWSLSPESHGQCRLWAYNRYQIWWRNVQRRYKWNTLKQRTVVTYVRHSIWRAGWGYKRSEHVIQCQFIGQLVSMLRGHEMVGHCMNSHLLQEVSLTTMKLFWTWLWLFITAPFQTVQACSQATSAEPPYWYQVSSILLG